MLRQCQWFLVLGVIRLAALQVDNLIVARVQGLTSVPSYSIPSRVFTILLTVGAMIYQPMWAANGEALARGEVHWVRRNTLRISLLGSGFMLAAGVAFIIVAEPVFRVWLGRQLELSYPLMIGLTVWGVLLCFAGPFFMVLNGANIIRPQIYIFGAFAAASIPLKYVAARFVGIWAVPWAAIIPYAIIVLPFALYQSGKILSKEQARSEQNKALTRDATSPAGLLPKGSTEHDSE
jgi:O-antigen/teichoic acid export membrane protein